jgi:hypothetical protein
LGILFPELLNYELLINKISIREACLMAKVLFTISYEIKPVKRNEYLSLASEMKNHFVNILGKEYDIFEQKGKKNIFSEVFTCNSIEEYDDLEDASDEKIQELISKLEEMIVGKMKYQTLIGIE